MADATFKSMIEQMEKRYAELTIKLEAYRDMHAEMTTLSRAIKVLKGEKLTPGYVSKKDRILAASDPDEYLQPPSDGVSSALRQILKANPKGMTTAEMGEALSKKGFGGDNHTVHNASRPFRKNLKVVGTNGNKKIYALAKEG
jgi:hypothetical protein